MARIEDRRNLGGTQPFAALDESSVRLMAGQPDGRVAPPALRHTRQRPVGQMAPASVPLAQAGARNGGGAGGAGSPDEPSRDEPSREEPSRDTATGPDPDAPGEGIVRDEEPAEPNEPG